MPPRYLGLTLLVCTLWASVGIVIKLTLTDAPPLGLGAVRMLLAAAALWLWLVWRSPPAWRSIPWRLVGTTTGFYVLLQAFTHAGFQHTSAARGIVLLNTTPLFVAVLVHLLPPHERITPLKGAGLALAFAGVCTIFGPSFKEAHNSTWLGDVLMLLAAASWSAHTLATTKHLDAGTLMLLQFLGAGVALALFSATSEPLARWHATPQLALGLVHLALVGTVFAWLLWVHVLKNVPAGTASAYIFTVPLIGVVLSSVVLGEPITLPFIGGAALVSAGITIVGWRSRRRPVPQARP